MKITVLGAGGWGTALARLLIQNGHQVTLWSWQQQQADEIGCFHENRSFLPGVLLPETLHVTCDMKEALSKTELAVFAVPSNASADVAAAAQPFIDSKVVLLNAAKGFAKERSLRISEVLREIYPENPIAVLSGPSHAEEVARDEITALCVAGEDPDTLCLVQDLLSNDHFRVYVNHDLVGVEIGGKHYAAPNQVENYLHNDPCDGCGCPRELCDTPCRVKRGWLEARQDVFL